MIRLGSLASSAGQVIQMELDSHADTCVVGANTALEIYDMDRQVQVHGYVESVGRKPRCRTIGAVVAYDHPGTGDTYMLVINQAILVPAMTCNLLSSMQLRDNDLKVNEEPKSMVERPTEDHHMVLIPESATTVGLRIPLSLHGVTSYFPTRKPTRREWETTPEELRLELTSESPEWDPSAEHFGEQQVAMLNSNGEMTYRSVKHNEKRVIAALHAENLHDPPEHFFGQALEATVGLPRGEKSSSGLKKVAMVDPKSEVANRLKGRGSIGPTGSRKNVIKAFHTSKRKFTIGARVLATNWGIGVKQARRTLDATTQKGLRTVLHPTLSRRFLTNDRQLRYRRLGHDIFTDTLEAGTTSWFQKNKYAQVFATWFSWIRVFPMHKKSEAHHGLSSMAARDGIPPVIVMDGSKEQTMGEFRRKARQMGIRVKQTEPYSPWQNAAEMAIREVKKGAGRKMVKAKSPSKLWDHCLELEGYIRSHTANDNYELQGQVPETILSGQTADISPFVEHPWYGWVKFYDHRSSYPEPREVLGRWLGPAIDIGPAMTSKILKSNGQVVYLSTFRGLTEDEMADRDETKLREEFDAKIKDKLGTPMADDTLKELDPDATTPEFELYEDDFEGTHEITPDAEDVTPEEADNYVGAEVNLPLGGTVQAGRVIRRARDESGDLTGVRNENPILDTRTYEVEFPDGQLAEYSANLIAEHMVSQCDPDGNQYLLMEAIVDHKKDGKAIEYVDRFVNVNGRQHLRKTTTGWKLCIKWKNGETSWERLADLKESYPIEVSKYAVNQGIDHEPAFGWWVPYVLKKRNMIIAAVNKRYHKRTHKFGFEIPKTVERALEIDRENGNTLWRDAINKEMSNIRVAFKILDDGKIPPGFQEMQCHMVFEIKLEGPFRRKCRLVAGGHMVDAPPVLTYSSVVARDTVRIALTLAALNDLEVKTSDIQNAYLTAPCEEKIWTVLGPEFGPDQGKRAIIVRALYGLKSAGGSYGRHISDCMQTLGYTPCKADPDLWMKPMIRPDDGVKYWAYVLLYVDDCLAIHHDAEGALLEIDKYFQMKKDSIGDPDIYLGAKLRKITLDNGVVAWNFSPSKYIQEAVRNVELYLDKNFGGRKLAKSARAPWPRDYYSELDTTAELDPTLAQYYQSQIGVLHWIVELGRVDIMTEVSTLAGHLAMPREGHLEAVFHVFAYIKMKHNSRMVFDPSYPSIDKSAFLKQDWTGFYGDVQEAIPLDRPEERGKEVVLRLYVDSDHAGDKMNRRSRTGFVIFLNSALIMWLSKKQPMIKTSVFGAEFVVMKQRMETLRGLHYKLQMMGVPIDGPSLIYGDNMSVIHNTQKPKSTLKKKSNQICYHAVRESVAMGESVMAHISTHENPADLATRIMQASQKCSYLVGKLLYDIHDH